MILQLVETGVLEPSRTDPAQWRFAGHALGRIDRALSLRHDLDINPAGVALVLELLNEIDRLRDR